MLCNLCDLRRVLLLSTAAATAPAADAETVVSGTTDSDAGHHLGCANVGGITFQLELTRYFLHAASFVGVGSSPWHSIRASMYFHLCFYLG